MIDVWKLLATDSRLHSIETKNLFRLKTQNAISTAEVESLEDLMSELSCVRKFVQREYNWFKSIAELQSQSQHEHEITSSFSQGKSIQSSTQKRRLLYLFVRDLTTGVSCDLLENKERRDFRQLEKVSLELKIVTWIFILLLNVGLLFYVCLFGMRQTHSRQSAWFRSFLMWIIFEIFVSSTGVVIFFHFFLPLIGLTEVSKMKEKILKDLTSYREKHGKTSNLKQVEELQHDKLEKVSFNAAQ
jgi:hypothetical protein